MNKIALIALRPYNKSACADYEGKIKNQMQVVRDVAYSEDLELQKNSRLRKAREDFLNSCSTYDHEYDLRQAKGKGEVAWFASCDAYHAWKKDGLTLWCSGIIGSGKTVLTANLIHKLMALETGASIAYFFFRYDRVESLKAETAISSLTKQILQASLIDFEKLHLDNTLPEALRFIKLLKTLPRSQNPIYILVDGLNDCDENQARALLGFCNNLLHIDTNYRVYCSSRPEIATWAQTVLRIDYTLDMASANEEIGDYINRTLLTCLDDGRLKLGQQKLILDISSTLTEKAQGM